MILLPVKDVMHYLTRGTGDSLFQTKVIVSIYSNRIRYFGKNSIWITGCRTKRKSFFEGGKVMSSSGLQVFDTTIQETNTWLHQISDEIGDPRKQVAYHALRGVLYALRDRLTIDEVFDLSAQMPMLIRGIFFEGYRPAGKPLKYHKDEFLSRINKELQTGGPVNTETATKAVLKVMNAHISQGEMDDIRNKMSHDLRLLLEPDLH